MLRCWALALRCGKFVVELLWACPLVVSVAGVRVVEFGSYESVQRLNLEQSTTIQELKSLLRYFSYVFCRFWWIKLCVYFKCTLFTQYLFQYTVFTWTDEWRQFDEHGGCCVWRFQLTFLPRHARIVRSSVLLLLSRPSVSVCLSVTLRYREHIGWTSSKVITRVILSLCYLDCHLYSCWFIECVISRPIYS